MVVEAEACQVYEFSPSTGGRSRMNKYVNLAPFWINKVVTEITGLTSFSGGIVEVIVVSGDGRVGAYLLVVDSATGDPTLIAITPRSPTGG